MPPGVPTGLPRRLVACARSRTVFHVDRTALKAISRTGDMVLDRGCVVLCGRDVAG